MSYLEKLLPEFRKGAKIRCSDWVEGYYIKKSGDYVVDNAGNDFFIHPSNLTSDNWEFYEEPFDWDYIIKNKCPCWFWDDDFENRALGFLYKIDQDNTKFPYGRDHNVWWCHCQPVNKDELTFFSEITK